MNKFFYIFLALFLWIGMGTNSLYGQNALNFDGTNDFVNCDNAASLQLNTGTIEVWIKTSNAGAGFRGIVVKNSAYGLFMNDNVLIGYSWGATGIITTSTSLNDNAWHHVAMSFQSGVTNGTKIYIDGILKVTSLLTVSTQTTGLSIGAGHISGGQNFTGNVEDVRIWSTVRTATEIANNRGCELAGTEAGLVSYYKMNQGTAGGTNTAITTLTDTKNANNGTLTNFALTGTTSNWVTASNSGLTISMVSIVASATTIASGTSVTFTATPNGGTSRTYQWKKNGNNVGTNSTTYTDATLTNGDVITCVMTSNNACGSSITATSNAITMLVTVPPSVSITASTTTICAGTSVTFTATPTNGGTPSYVWKKNGNTMSGEVSSTYTTTGLANGDIISCVMTSSLANASPTTATSNSVTMTVNAFPSVTLSNTGANNLVGTAVLSVNSTTASDIKWYNGATLANTSALLPATSGTTAAGGNGSGSAANQISYPQGIYVDGSGNMYISDQNNHRIQKWAPGATSGTTVAGGNGIGSAANQLSNPQGIYVDASGNVYIADFDNSRIQKWAPGASTGTTVAGGNGYGSAANQLTNPQSIYVDGSGNMYMADYNNYRIQKWAPGASTGTTVAGGNGSGSDANQLSAPNGIYVDGSGNIYIADVFNYRIQKWAAGASTGTTVAGGNDYGPADNQFIPIGISVDGSGNMYISDQGNHRIQKWAAGASSGTTVAGGNGNGSGADQLNGPSGIYVDGSGNIYIADVSNHRIQKWAPGAAVNTYTPTTAGSYTAVVTVNGCSATTNAITIDALVTPSVSIAITTGSQTPCANAVVTITATPTNGGTSPTYQWKKNGVNIDGETNTFYSATSWVNNDVISCVMTSNAPNASPTTATSNNIVITVSAPTPVITGATTGCGSVTLTASGGTMYQWSSGQNSADGATFTTSGTYTVTVTDNATGCSATKSVVVTVNAVPSVTLSNTGANNLVGTAVLSVNSTTATDIKWYNGATLVNTASAVIGVGTSVAGGNDYGSAANQLAYPSGVYVDVTGNIYVTDQGNHRVQKWAPGASTGTRVAGGNGSGLAANQLNNPAGIYVDASGNMYIVDQNNHRIQKWAAGATTGTTVAGDNGSGSAANQLNNPSGIYVDASGNMYIADQNNHRIQKWAAGATTGTTVAGGNGSGSAADQLNTPSGIYVDASDNMYIADKSNNRIQKWAAGATTGSTVAGGNGPGSAADRLDNPIGIYVDASGNMFILEYFNHRVQKWAAGATTGTTVAGGNGYGSAANQLASPTGIYLDATGSIYIADKYNYRVQKWAQGAVNTYTPTTAGSYTAVVTVNGCSATTNAITVSNPTPSVSIAASVTTICAGTSVTFTATPTNGGTPTYVWKKNGNTMSGEVSGTYTTTGLANGDIISCVMTSSLANASPTTATSNSVTMTVNPAPSVTLSNTGANNDLGTAVLSVNSATTAEEIKWYNGTTLVSTATLTTASNTTVAGGNGWGAASNQLAAPSGIYVDGSGNMYIGDLENFRIQKWAAGATSGTTVAGNNGQGGAANQFDNIGDIYVDGSGNIYVTDYYNNRIQKWAPGATTGTKAAGGNGSGSAANQLRNPRGIYVDAGGNVYIADVYNHRVQKWAPGATTGTTVAGGNGEGLAANQLSAPTDVHVDGSGNIYIADAGNDRIQKWVAGATTGTTVAGDNGAGSAANQFNSPERIYVDGSGNMYIADVFNNRIQKWAAGATSGVTVVSSMTPQYIDVDAAGSIYVSQAANNRIQKFTLAAIANTYTPTTTGSYTAVVTVNGCSATTNAITVSSPIPSVSIAASATTVCAGTSVTFTATPTNGGTTPQYQWKKNGNNVGTNSNTYTDAGLANSDMITCVMTSSLANVSPTTATSNSITMTINALPSVTLSNTGANTLVGTAALSVNSTTASDIKWYNAATLANTSATVVNIITAAGGNGQGSGANQFNNPAGIYVDASGNMYIADQVNQRIQKWAQGASNGITVAGGNGQGSAANQLYDPKGIYVDASGNIYIADEKNHRIQKWAPGASTGTTVAGGNGRGSDANQFNHTGDIYVDASGNMYIADEDNNRIQKWAPGATTGITVANGLTSPQGIDIDASGNMYIADGGQSIKKWALGASTGTTVAGGNGYGSAANQLAGAYSVMLDASGNMYITDRSNDRIQKWAPGATTGTTVAGGNGEGSAANQLDIPYDTYVDAFGNIYIADYVNHRIQKGIPIAANTYTPTTAGSYTAVVTVNGCSATTNAITVITPPSVSIAITSGSQNMCAGAVSSVTFTATPTNGGTTPQYQWKKNGNDVGTNSTTYTDAALANSDIITCVLTSSVPNLPIPTATSNGITIAVTPLPSINAVSNQTVCVGTVTTAVAFSGTGATSYTWTNNNTAIGLAASGTGNIGAFTATNSTTSAITATITVTPKAGAANCAGTPTTFTITVNPKPVVYAVTGGGTSCDGSGVAVGLSNSELGVNYQLKRGGVNTGSPVAGTGSAISFGNQTTTGIYTATAVNATTNCVINMTGSANVENNATTLTPSVTIAANPSGAIYTISSVTFTATPTTGGTTPQYQWQKNGANVGNNSATYTNNSWTDGDVVTCILTSNHPCAAPTTATSNSVVISATTAPPGGALNFDGTNDYVSVPDAASLDLTNAFTLESWVYPTAYATTAAPTYGIQGFISKNQNASGSSGYFLGMVSGNLSVLMNNGTNINATSTTQVPLNTWSHVAATYDGTTIRLYLNGTQVFTQALSSFILINSTQPLYIGGTGTSGTSTWLFKGNMDEARVWNIARSASQIANNRSCELVGNESGLVAYYKFNQGGAEIPNTGLTTLTDATANANNGTLSNFALTGATSNWVLGNSNIGAAVTPSVVIAASPSGTITAGTSVTFTATPTNGGAAPTYVWKKNGTVIDGEVNAMYTSTTLANGDIITCEMTSNATCATTALATSTGITMSVTSPSTYTWTGATSTDWATATNWNPNGIPTSSDNVIIPTTANKPMLPANQTIANLSLTGTNKVMLGNSTLCVNAITGGSSSTYVVTDGTGSLIIKALSTSTPTTFPIGASETSYDPLSIKPTNSVDFTVKVKTTAAAEDFSGSITNYAKTVKRQWDITPTGKCRFNGFNFDKRRYQLIHVTGTAQSGSL